MFDITTDSMQQASFTICTTPWKENPAQRAWTHFVAKQFNAPLVERRERSLTRMFSDLACNVIVVAEPIPKLYHSLAPDIPLFFHPGMAQLRLLSMFRKEPDRLVRLARIQPGDQIVDATFGLGTDSLVLAFACGARGRVIGLESVIWLVQMFKCTQIQKMQKWAERNVQKSDCKCAKIQRQTPIMRNWDALFGTLLQRIEVCHILYTEWLANMPDNAVDVIYFDPMFANPIVDSAGIAPLRAFANTAELNEEAWTHACRVARRCVIVKERPQAQVFRRFGLTPDKPRAKIAYGVWNKE